MRRRRAGAIVSFVAALSLSGLAAQLSCRTAPTPPAAPTLNAVLSDSSPRLSADYDTAVLAYMESVLDYAREERGRWTRHWYLCTARKFETLKGSLDADRIRFVHTEDLPTPGSGAMLSRAPFPYRAGMVLLLGLKAAQTPFVIVYEEERSRVPPYAELHRPGDVSPAQHQRIRKAVLDYVGEASGPVRVVEEASGYYVATFDETSDEPVTLMVDKLTFRASLLAFPEAGEPAEGQ